MPVLKKNVAPLLQRSTESLTLAIELFNRPSPLARTHGVLILLQHSFEMLLKAIILQQTGTVHDREQRYSYGFDKCLSVASAELKILDSDQRATLSILDSQRDQAAHFYVEMSEDMLYVHAQSAVTLFDSLLAKAFKRRLADVLPSRILPISAHPPRDLHLLLSSELDEVDRLLEDNTRKGARAAARLRSVLAFAVGSREGTQRVPESDIDAAIARRRKKEEWELILPEIAQLRLSTDGSGIPIEMRISKKQTAIAVAVAKPGDRADGILLKQEIDPWTVYTMGRDDLAKKVGLTGPKVHAVIFELDLQNDPECYHELTRKSQTHKAYSKKALDRIREELPKLDMDAVWSRHGEKLAPRKRAKR
jgi:hypothetical protein